MKTLPTARACSSLTFAFGSAAPVDPDDGSVGRFGDDELSVGFVDDFDSFAVSLGPSSTPRPSKGTWIGSGILPGDAWDGESD